MAAAIKEAIDVRTPRDPADDDLYSAALEYMAALEAWLESAQDSPIRGNAAYSRHRLQMTELFLLKVFPEKFDDRE